MGLYRRMKNERRMRRLAELPLQEPDAEVRLPALENALPAGTRVRSLRDSVPGIPQLTGYDDLLGTVVIDPGNPERGTGDGFIVVVRWDWDPAEEYVTQGFTKDDLVWVWNREDIEVVDPHAYA